MSGLPHAELLDVNVLIALAWPNHHGHAAARDWFRAHARNGWATTPITESGFVRVSSNRLALPAATTPSAAITLLRQLTSASGHRFWADDVQHVLDDVIDPANVTGYRQVTDAHLLALCRAREGRLVTFDTALATLVPEMGDLVRVLT